DPLLLRCHRDLILSDSYLLAGDHLILLCQVALQDPLLFTALLTGDLAEKRSEASEQTATRVGTTHHGPNDPKDRARYLPVARPFADELLVVAYLNLRALLL